MLWEHISEPIWATCNKIKHLANDAVSPDMSAKLHDKVLWYLHHQDEVLNYRHMFLADYDPTNVNQWSWPTQHAKVTMLDNVRLFHETQYTQHSRHQQTINDWFDSYTSWRRTLLLTPVTRWRQCVCDLASGLE